MTRKKKLMLNTVFSLINEIVAIVCGFILPRYFLLYFGSKTNGLISSVTQFLGFISLAECGVGAVVQSALYKPLADNDLNGISKIFISSERFFKRIALALLGYTIILMIAYPMITLDSYEFLFTATLILIISISSFAQYYIGMTYKLLLNANQLGFIQYIISMMSLVLNTVTCVLLMKNGATIHIVKLATSLIFSLQPVFLSLIVKRKFKIDRSVVITEEPIKQKWNGIAHHISGVVLGNTDVVVLTLFSSLENVSVYAVYHLVLNGVKQIIVSLTNGFRALFGNMIAKNETATLRNAFDRVEWIMHSLVTFVFSLTAVLIIPFVKVYTNSITDIDYIVPVFAYLITLAEASYCLRLPYYVLINAAGHYKQTQMSAIIEAVINVVVSVILVFNFGLIGVAIGTLAAMTYRTIYFVIYLRKNILYRKIRHFIVHLVVDMCEVCILFVIVNAFSSFYVLNNTDYLSWVALAIKVAATAGLIMLIINGIVYHDKFKHLFNLLRTKKQSSGEIL